VVVLRPHQTIFFHLMQSGDDGEVVAVEIACNLSLPQAGMLTQDVQDVFSSSFHCYQFLSFLYLYYSTKEIVCQPLF
jgi:hypothetical protein